MTVIFPGLLLFIKPIAVMRKRSGQMPASINKLFLLLSSLFFSAFAFSQNVTGTVTDGSKPVANVSVQVKGTSVLTSTDDAGKFSIRASGNDVLLFSSVGFAKQEVSVNGKQNLNIVLSAEASSMTDVVVTALGITKKSRGLGYSASNVNPDELTETRTPHPINALEGKVAGVNISSLGTGPGGFFKIRIRGQSAITGGDNPLIVINGVPINSQSFNGSTVGVNGGGVYSDGGDSYASINPDDIESMTVLKGAP